MAVVARVVCALLAAVALLLTPVLAQATEPTFTVEVGGAVHVFTRSQLLADPALTEIQVARDNAYLAPIRYQALPLEHLLAGFDLPRDQV
jgi:hypothetical protein